MPFSQWVVPLSDEELDALDAVARRRKLVTLDDEARLGAQVAALSARYNATSTDGGPVAARELAAARLLFSFPRDVPKSAAAVRELIGTGLLRLRADRPLRVLDLGAGLGATTFGVARALAASGQEGALEATLVDEDGDALALAADIARELFRGPSRPVRVDVRPRVEAVGGDPRIGRQDLILVGQALSELDRDRSPEERVARHAQWLDGLVRQHLAPRGSLVVVEPALRERSRHLHRIRDAMARAGLTVFAPCLHAEPCPALAHETDWCHEDLPVALPPRLVGVARSAGLRWEGLTFSYLVVRADGLSLRGALGEDPALRAVSSLLRSKGKTEAYLCGDLPKGAGKALVRRLDRDAADVDDGWGGIGRGALVRIAPPPGDNGRLGREARVEPIEPSRLDGDA